MRRSRLLVLTLTIALTATGAGWYGSPAGAADPVGTETIRRVSPAGPVLGDTITVTASVAPQDDPLDASVPGQVPFWASRELNFSWEDDGSFGPVPVVDGTASLEIELSAAVVPFLATDPEDVFVAARYEPPAGDEYAGSDSQPVRAASQIWRSRGDAVLFSTNPRPPVVLPRMWCDRRFRGDADGLRRCRSTYLLAEDPRPEPALGAFVLPGPSRPVVDHRKETHGAGRQAGGRRGDR